MAIYTQDNRGMRIDTTLGVDELLLVGFEGHEAISAPYALTASLLSEKPDIAPRDLIETPMVISMATSGSTPRFFHGLVRRMVQHGRRDDLTAYSVELVPWFWFTSLSSDCRVFQRMSVLEIIETLFGELGHSDYAIKTTKNYPKREYCVQYRETHFAFISRLMEEEGIFYFFDHQKDKHLMVLGDSTSAIKPCPAQSKVRVTAEAKAPAGEDVITSWSHEQSACSGKVALVDYDPVKPSANLSATAEGASSAERFDYPGQYSTLDEGQRYAALQLESFEVGGTTVSGAGSARALTAGFKFDLREHYRRDVNSSYLVTSVQHKAAGGDVRSWNSSHLDYQNTFRAIPAATVYRPSPNTPRPRIFGTLPAVVTGPKGEEIHVDKHARVKIQFFWDRYGKRDEKSSCWVRVATTWAGKGWGAIHIPRIGQEVVVGFLDGNPDQPMIVGSVFNGEQTPPEGLPGAMTQSGIRSSTHKGKGMNELIMDDTAGKERFNIHAQYDMSTTVQHDQTNTVNNHRTTSIAVNDTETVGSNQKIDIAAKQSVSVGADQKIGVSGKLDYTVGGNLTITTGSAAKFSSTGAMTIEADGAQKVITKAEQTLSAAGSTTIKSGASMKISATGELAITAASLKITVAGNTVEIGPAGVKINSPALVDIKGSVVKVNS